MYAIYGSFLTAAAIIGVALLVMLFGNPRAPRWTRWELTATLAAVMITIPLGLGLALLFLTPAQLMANGARFEDIAALVGALVLVAVVLRVFRIGTRISGHAAAAVVHQPSPEPPAA